VESLGLPKLAAAQRYCAIKLITAWNLPGGKLSELQKNGQNTQRPRPPEFDSCSQAIDLKKIFGIENVPPQNKSSIKSKTYDINCRTRVAHTG